MTEDAHVFTIQLAVKGDSRQQAESKVAAVLYEWLLADVNQDAPCAPGSLLWWEINKKEA